MWLALKFSNTRNKRPPSPEWTLVVRFISRRSESSTTVSSCRTSTHAEEEKHRKGEGRVWFLTFVCFLLVVEGKKRDNGKVNSLR